MVRKALGQDFQRHVPVQLAIPDAVYLSHSADSERAADFIVAEVVTDRQQHRLSNDSTLEWRPTTVTPHPSATSKSLARAGFPSPYALLPCATPAHRPPERPRSPWPAAWI